LSTPAAEDDTWTVAGRTFRSRLIVGTGKYKDYATNAAAAEAAGAEIVTVAVRRVNLTDPTQPMLVDYLKPDRFTYLPNTAGCFTGEEAVRTLLAWAGDDPDRDGLLETPARVARMYAEMFSGLHLDPKVHLQKAFTEKYDEIVLVRDIAFNSICEHHLLPFMGHAHIGYLPDGRVLGLSKLARLVEVVSHRPQVQERMTEQIADLLVDDLGAKGVAVVVEASHTCMTIRGVRKPGSVCVTSAMKGLFRSNISSRAEVMSLIYGNGNRAP
jgi:GTP cyclohydrolase I